MKERIVITGVGLTSPNGDNLEQMRDALLNDRSGITHEEVRHMGIQAVGLVNFPEDKYQSKKMRKRGTRAGAISIYCANEAVLDANINLDEFNKDRIGIFLGITEHGNVETEEEIHKLYQENGMNTDYWSHHHNPRTVANSPAGEVTLNLKITGPAYTIGAACAAGNMGLIQAAQMLMLGEVDLALCGGISESAQTFGIFAAFKAQGALGFNQDPTKASKPLSCDRNGIVISEGGCIYTLERLSDAIKRGATIHGELISYYTNSDASDFVLPNVARQIQCMENTLKRAGLEASDIDLVNLHATGTMQGDIQECEAVSQVFGYSDNTHVNCTKGFIGHAMGAAGALELAGNLPSFQDGYIHPCKNITEIDPKCDLKNLIKNKPIQKEVNIILNNSFGMLGINSSVLIKKYKK